MSRRNDYDYFDLDNFDARFDVFADHLVDLLERSAFVPGVEVGFGVVHIGYAQAVPGCCRVVGHAEHVCQYEMGISPANQRFAFAGLEPRGGILYGINSVLVGNTFLSL